MIRSIISILLLPVILSGCYAYRVFPKSYRHFEAPAATQTVYIINPELKKEFEILKAAGIYIISNDSTNHLAIKLYPMQRNFVCGQPIVGSILFLGQLPAYLPDRYQFIYEEQQDGTTRQFKYELKVATRIWFWDMFTFQKNFKKFAGKALAGSRHQEKLVAHQQP